MQRITGRTLCLSLPPLVVSALAACAGGGGAFGTGGQGGANAPQYEIRFEVSCDTCDISYQVGFTDGRLRETALWSHRVRINAMGGEVARLSAAPVDGARGVSYVRIRVNGEVVAERTSRSPDQRGSTTQLGPGMTIQVAIPPP